MLILPLHLVLFTGEMVLFLLMGKFRLVREVYVAALEDNLRLFKDTMKERTRIQGLRKKSDLAVLSNVSFKLSKLAVLMHVGIPEFKYE
jgi:hypothetical protein